VLLTSEKVICYLLVMVSATVVSYFCLEVYITIVWGMLVRGGYRVCPTNCGLPFQASQRIPFVCLFLTSGDAISLSFVSCTTVSFLHTEYKKLNVVSTCKIYFFPYCTPHYEVQIFFFQEEISLASAV
jgi:hypothetical protein